MDSLHHAITASICLNIVLSGEGVVDQARKNPASESWQGLISAE
ncbi:hypothetical protein [Photobacterium arenosum]|nr:hypothetical protein [Photobacterium arenosum]